MAASFILCIFRFFRLLLSGHQAVAIENAAFRLQLAVFRRQRKRPVFTVVDRMFSDRSLSALSVRRQRPLARKVGAGPSHRAVLPRCLHIAGATGATRISECPADLQPAVSGCIRSFAYDCRRSKANGRQGWIPCCPPYVESEAESEPSLMMPVITISCVFSEQ